MRLLLIPPHHRKRIIRFEPDGIIVDLDGSADLVQPERLAAPTDSAVEVEGIESEHDIVGGEGVSVGPPGAFAQVDGEALEVVGQFEALGQIAHDFVIGADVAEVAPPLGLFLQGVPR